MPFPRTRHELEQAGYVFLRRQQCSGPTCSTTVEWWKTPKGKMIPLEFRESHGVEICEPHWTSCADRDRFRRRPGSLQKRTYGEPTK